MSFAKLSFDPQADGDPARASDEVRFCQDVADGLHALAQPLSILRSAVEMFALCGPENTRYLSAASQQMDRTSRIFLSLQHLVAARMEPSRNVELDLRELAQPIVEDWRQSLAGFGIELTCSLPDSPLSAMGSVQRTEQTIAALIEAAAASSARGERVELTLESVPDGAACSVATTRKGVQRISSSGRLSVALARWNMASQSGRLDVYEDPFRITAAWPSRDGAENGIEDLHARTTG